MIFVINGDNRLINHLNKLIIQIIVKNIYLWYLR